MVARTPGLSISLRLADLYSGGGLVIGGPVFIEIHASPSVSEDFIDKFLPRTGIAVKFELEEKVWHSAAQGFAAYAHRRRRSAAGKPKRVPVDFLIAAHASLRADQLMT